MSKRLFALITTVALVFSMFTGTALAEQESTASLALSTTEVISSAPHTEYQLIKGVVYTGSSAGYNFKVRVMGQKAGVIYDELDAPSGQFYFYLPTNLEPQAVTVTAISAGQVIAESTIAVRYKVTVTPHELKFSFTGQQEPVVITGKVTNSRGEPIADQSVMLMGVDAEGKASSNSYFTGVKTNAKGEFGSLVLQWLAAEPLELLIGSDETSAVTHLQGQVAPKLGNLEVTPNSTVCTIVQTCFAVVGSGFDQEGETVTFQLLKGTEPVAASDSPALPQGVQTAADGKFATSFAWTPQQAGTYTLVASTGNYRAATTIVVANPTSYNLINSSKLEELEVGENERSIGPSDIHLVHYLASASYTNEFVYTIYIDGQLAQDTVSGQDFVKLAEGKIAIPATQLGTKTIRLVAHQLADKYNPDAKPIFDCTITAKVKGWAVTLEPTEITVNQTQDITLVVKDEKGEAINNAIIEIDGHLIHTPGHSSVQNGTYNFKDVTMTSVGPKIVRVYQGSQLMAQLELQVLGQQVYDVQADVTTLLQGQEEDVKLTVTHDGSAVMPWLVRLIYEDGTSDVAYPTYLGDGISHVTLKAVQAGELTIRVENVDGNLCGETTVSVIAPQLTLLDEATVNLTNNFKTRVRFRVIDPRDGSILPENLEIVPLHLAGAQVFDQHGGVIGSTILGATEHALTFLPQAVASDWQAAAAAHEIVAIGFKVNGVLVNGIFPVKEASLTSDPDRILVGGKNNLTLSYLDANGKPIVGKQIEVDGRPLGTTNANGQIIYPVSVVIAPAVEVKANTEVTAAQVSLSIRLAYDTDAPQVAYKVVGNRATFTITDNLRIVRISIDGEDIDFWPAPSYQFQRTLRPGANRVHIKAQDSNNNVLNEVITIEYVPKPESVVLRGGQVMRHGDFAFVQARQFEDLGAKFIWKSGPKAATFTLNGNRVEVIIGSIIAKVNGTPVAMPAAPFLANERTYIPLRFVSETLGWKVHWAPGDVITITID